MHHARTSPSRISIYTTHVVVHTLSSSREKFFLATPGAAAASVHVHVESEG